MRLAHPWLGASIATAALILGGSAFAPAGAQVDVTQAGACVAEVEPNDSVAQATTIEGEQCVSGTLIETGDRDVFRWQVRDADAAASWSLRVVGVPETVTSVDVVRVDRATEERVSHIDVGPGSEPATADVMVEAGDYAFVISRQDPPAGVELDAEAEYQLQLARAEPPATPAPAVVVGESGRVLVAVGDGQTPTIGNEVALELLLDTSGSMLERLGQPTKLQVAQRALVDLVDALPNGTPVALRTFQAKPRSCATVLRVPLKPLRPKAMKQTIRQLPVRKGTRTPLANALEKVPRDLAGADGHRVVVVVTDGKENCDGDPEVAIRALADAGYTSTIHLIGYALPDDSSLPAAMAEWAAIGGGRFLEATDRASLAAALEAATTAPYLVLDEEGRLVAQGLVGDDGVEVEVGVYRVEVLGEPPSTFESVEVEADGVVQLSTGPDDMASD